MPEISEDELAINIICVESLVPPFVNKYEVYSLSEDGHQKYELSEGNDVSRTSDIKKLVRSFLTKGKEMYTHNPPKIDVKTVVESGRISVYSNLSMNESEGARGLIYSSSDVFLLRELNNDELRNVVKDLGELIGECSKEFGN